ncbi:MAG: hypothetical protein H7Z43_08630, partial [Clostridia bacterium]|nr:hypothetical protein [Deltaproteobacteria bacterium]
EPGREGDAVANGIDALKNSVESSNANGLDEMKNSVELSHSMGIQYLEMQYKFQLASTNYGAISNMMKARSETIKKSLDGVR